MRDALPLDPELALKVKDARVKAAFAMAPGIIKAFGMDEVGLKQLDVPAYITVGRRRADSTLTRIITPLFPYTK